MFIVIIRVSLIFLFIVMPSVLGALEVSIKPIPRPHKIDLLSLPPQVSVIPQQRPQKVETKAKKEKALIKRGAVCGDLDIQGTYVGYVSGKWAGCGMSDGVKISSVSGIPLSAKSIMDCKTATALKKWINRGLLPNVGNQGGGVFKLSVIGHYSCRTRNNQAGAKISEHGKGRAIDIEGFWLENGQKITLLKHWNSKKWSNRLRKMHKAACGPFGTVLGPNANKYHQDHFHFDTARYRSGPYCR